ncbi:MAG: urea transporter, partial [Planctomycetaceae bacterium]
MTPAVAHDESPVATWPPRVPPALAEMAAAVFSTYALIVLASGPRLGACLAAVTFLDPVIGLMGLAGTCVAYAAADALGFDRQRLRSGLLLASPLLASLGVGWLARLHPVGWPFLAILLPAVATATLAVTVAVGQALRTLFSLPALSLPFVATTALVFAAFQSLAPAGAGGPRFLLPEPAWLPEPLLLFFRAFGTAFFTPHALAGVAVAALVLVHSRLLVALAAFGYAVGVNAVWQTGLAHESFGDGWLGTNFIYCGMAIGALFFIASPGSLAVAAFGAVVTAVMAAGLLRPLGVLGLPMLSLPFAAWTLLTIHVLRQRHVQRGVFENPWPELAPEEAWRRFTVGRLRFPAGHLPGLRLPFSGQRVVTQGMHGVLTHRGTSAHAFDFEALDAGGHAWPPGRTRLADAYTFGTPVLAPCAGVVTRVVDTVPDNPPGTENLRDNWGNLVTILGDSGGYVTLCHFQEGGIDVAAGDRVTAGQVLGRCGNSGRSPLPHLHLQMQVGPAPTSATTPFRLLHYVAVEPDGTRRFHAGGVPPQGERIEPAGFDGSVASCFDLTGSRRQRFRVERDGAAAGVETLDVDATSWGDVALTSVERRTSVAITPLPGLVYAHSLAGCDARTADSLPAVLSLGLSLVPLCADRGLVWNDHAAARPFRGPALGLIADAIDPFVGGGTIRLAHRFEPRPELDGVAVRTELGGAIASCTIVVALRPGAGIVEVVVEHDTGRTTRYVRDDV